MRPVPPPPPVGDPTWDKIVDEIADIIREDEHDRSRNWFTVPKRNMLERATAARMIAGAVHAILEREGSHAE